MNRNESKYFNTATRMDKAFLELLEKKDFSYITVKEICEKAGVNRSTFYLHYETIDDLLSESVEYMNEHFLTFMRKDSDAFMNRIQDRPIDELNLITPDYLRPYLSYVKENRRLFLTAMKRSNDLRLNDNYNKMFRYVFTPILERFGIPLSDRQYLLTFYINGIMAIITEWLDKDCTDDIEHIISIIQLCIGKERL